LGVWLTLQPAQVFVIDKVFQMTDIVVDEFYDDPLFQRILKRIKRHNPRMSQMDAFDEACIEYYEATLNED
jgi:hypothetical protein